jgi:hypothetical protein
MLEIIKGKRRRSSRGFPTAPSPFSLDYLKHDVVLV